MSLKAFMILLALVWFVMQGVMVALKMLWCEKMPWWVVPWPSALIVLLAAWALFQLYRDTRGGL